MLGKRNNVEEAINTIIGRGIRLEVKLISGTGAIRVDGTVVGDINIDGNMVIGESGRVEGTVSAKSALIAGNINGNINCMGVLHVSGTGSVSGAIDTTSIIIDDGAVFNGTCNMVSNSRIDSVSSNIKKFEKEQPATSTI